METNDEEKLIINGELFYSVRTYFRQKKTSAEIIAKIEELLKVGADISACDSNDNNNTILHIAVQKEEKDVVIYLLQKGAHLYSMQDLKRALNLALQKNTALGKEIAAIISKHNIALDENTGEISYKQLLNTEENANKENKAAIDTTSNVQYTYSKRAGTSGVSGQFYETKLLSLVLHRALHDKDINEFYLAANIKDIGDFDDVCFRYQNVTCFMQSKHRENTDKAKLTVASVRSSTGKLGLGIYYDSFLKIRQKFSPNAADPMFQGKFDDIDCYFVLYTPLKESFDRKLRGNKEMCSKLHDIIYTGKKEDNKNNKCTDIFQFDFEKRDIDFLTTFIKYDHLKILGKTFLEFILSKNKLEAMMASDLIKVYHPALAQKVILISKVVSEAPKSTNSSKALNISQGSNNSHIHIGKFRAEFFDSENQYLMQLKDTFYREIVYTHSGKISMSKEELKQKIQDIAKYTCAETISQLIGSPIKFDDANDKLCLDINKLPKKLLKQDDIQQIMFCLQNIQVTKTMIRDAVYIAGRKKLQMLTFVLPLSFGNIDLTINKKKGPERLDFLANKFHKLIKHFAKQNENQEIKVIEITADVVGPSKILEVSHLDSNGIGGAVGNLLEFDTDTELFSFNTRIDLPENAQYILQKLKILVNEDLSNYKIKVLLDGFPRTSFDIYQYDKDLASYFLSKLWFYTNQAQEESVEATIKQEINVIYNADKQRSKFLFHVHSDAIFLRFHDKMQKWWKRSTDAEYLTKNTTIYEEAKKDIVDSPLLTVLSVMFIRKIKEIGMEFNRYAIENLTLDDFERNTKNKALNIISDAVILSAAKFIQRTEYRNNYTYINLDYVHILPQNDYETMIRELQVLKDVTLVIISETSLDQRLQDTLLNILNTFTKNLITLEKQIIIITGEPLAIDIKQIFHNYSYVTLHDDCINLIDMSAQSQKKILNTSQIIYQGQTVGMNKIIDNDAIELINAKLLWSLLKKDKIEIGHKIESKKYNEIKSHFINRSVKRGGENYDVNTLYDIDDKIVLISSKPCMGKTILMTHVALETKKINPKLWIVMIDMASCAKNLEILRKASTKAIMEFLIKVALKNSKEIEKVTFIQINNETVAINGDDTENVSFELKLFIHLYNNGNIIFLFDGFDKIFPQSTNEALELFTALGLAKKRMWISSDCYVIKVLKQRFGSPYKLERLTTIQQKNFLERFWSTNLQLEKLNYEQFNNFVLFFEYILKNFDSNIDILDDFDARHKLPYLSVTLHIIYLTILDHFKNESDSLSPCYFRERIKKEFNLDSYTNFDRYLQNCNDNDSLELAGTPLHLYIAANYFAFQITDRFDLHINNKIFLDRSNIYMNSVFLYKRFLQTNMKEICDIETAFGEKEGRIIKMREDFLEKHKKLALYAIYKEKDLAFILTPSDIKEVKQTISMIESGELKTDLIDSVIDGVPRFYHLLFAEYFAVECLADILDNLSNRNFDNLNLASFWNCFVNILLVCSPSGLRNAFEYKLKYNPHLAKVASNENNNKIIFELLLKRNENGDDNALKIATDEGLVNIANMLLGTIRDNVGNSNVDRVMTILQSSAHIAEALDPSMSVVNENVIRCLQNLNGETIVKALKLNQVENDITKNVRDLIAKPATKLKELIDQAGEGNENAVSLINELPNHLPYFLRDIFNKK